MPMVPAAGRPFRGNCRVILKAFSSPKYGWFDGG
jgi:hypothetical protein